MEFLWEGVMAITPQQFVMYLIGGLLIWLAVKKEYEPALLLPMGFGAIMVNLPLSGVINQVTEGIFYITNRKGKTCKWFFPFIVNKR